jgi:hypothetical protein
MDAIAALLVSLFGRDHADAHELSALQVCARAVVRRPDPRRTDEID